MTARSQFGNPRLNPIAITFSGSGDNTIVAAVTGGIIELYKVYLVVGGATNLTWKDGASNSLSGAIPMLANGSFVLDFDGSNWHETSSGNALVLNSSNAVQVSGAAYYMVR